MTNHKPSEEEFFRLVIDELLPRLQIPQSRFRSGIDTYQRRLEEAIEMLYAVSRFVPTFEDTRISGVIFKILIPQREMLKTSREMDMRQCWETILLGLYDIASVSPADTIARQSGVTRERTRQIREAVDFIRGDQMIRADAAAKMLNLDPGTLRKRAKRERWYTEKRGPMNSYRAADLEKAYPDRFGGI